MNRVRRLVTTPVLSIARYDHFPEADHCDDAEEVCADFAINFVVSGSFELGIGKNDWVLLAGSQFVSRPGIVHRYRHLHGEANDVCLSVRYSAVEPQKENWSHDGPLSRNNRLEFLKLQLTDLMNRQDQLAIESWGCELLSAIEPRTSNARLYREPQLRWYADRVEAARAILEKEFTASHSLSALARRAGMSTFHFARVFSELTGRPPHRYLLELRLKHARELLLGGLSVTRSCYDSGFANLSHFTRSFRRRFGCLPSAAKKTRK
jgi:AraC family transcriptional regulator